MTGLRKQFLIILIFLFLPLIAVAQEGDQTWKVNLKDADIRAFVTQVSDITGYSFVIDPRVKGKVTVLSNTPMNQAEIYDMFLSVLQVHGFTAIPGDEVIKIVQQNDAKQAAENTGRFSVIPSEQLLTRVIEINNADALELVPILRPMVAQYGHLAGVSAANALIISDHAANIERIERIVRELDSPSKYELEVVQLQEAWVGDVVKLLEQLAPAELGEGSKRSAAAKYSVVADERSNRLIVRGDENFRSKMLALIAKLDQPAENGGDTRVIRLNHADAEKLSELLKGIMGDVAREANGGARAGQQAATGLSQQNSEVSIYADEGLNSLVVRATPSLLQEVEFIVAQLDVRRAQVLIEAAIVEISDDLGRDLGVQWGLGDESGEATPVMGTNFGNVGLSLTNILGAIAQDEVIPPAEGGISIGAGQRDRNGISWGVLIQALSRTTAANLLSTPSIITLDNSESEIVVGQNVPFRTGQTTTTSGGTTNPFTTIERQDIGLTLKVTPSISTDSVVRMIVEQTTEDIASSVSQAADIITNKREIKTTVLVDDGETIVLGGLIREDYRLNTSKVPFLGDIPYLGALFRSESQEKTKRNLLVFLRPTILRDKGEAREVSQNSYDRLWEVDVSGVKGGDLPASERPPLESVFEGNRLKFLR
ncbi:type II secretion system secretin GspD [Hydrocarboniclastica marina]|uniref:Type II secretion system protein GspD n=1 Tax=Hydrocarboniclastica marina TaxID=2259620 RepID=A0A4P7XKF7_9ALTE|nr:type II secretion system secretin GspD [Hydrocarboniclastica marina]MAM00550.1 type II secretion system protein GspD [Alteromonadaceae bacterium]QCF26417.1 type II secretion system protein GspD [Hydrocarboniclastica marina]|tara:strand:+ start:2874 stop:4835 length:1962 start_codon:yes stop_codon:yes gene_type:complete